MRTGKDAMLFRVASAAHHRGLTPNMMTAMGLALGVTSGVLFAYRAFPFAFALGFLSVFCDVLDGTLARKFHLETKTGLVFDSVSDRVTEAATVAGALVGGIIAPAGTFAVVGSVALLVLRSLSWRRGLATDYAVFGRFERLLFILIGLLIPISSASTICFVVAGLFGLVSALQIAFHLSRSNKKIANF